MAQENIRDFNNQTYTVPEGAAIVKELDRRTKHNEEGYDTLALLAERVKSLELANSVSVVKQKTQIGGQVNVFLLNEGDHPNAIELHEDGQYRVETEFYTYTKGIGVNRSQIALINGRFFEPGTILNLLKIY